MAGDFSGAAGEAADAIKRGADEATRLQSALSQAVTHFRALSSGGGGISPTGGGGGFSSAVSTAIGGGTGGGGGGGFSTIPTSGAPQFTGENRTSGLLKGLGLTTAGLVGMLPTTQEALTMGTMSDRLRFYSSSTNKDSFYDARHTGPIGPNRNERVGNSLGYTLMNEMSRKGTPTSALDVANAINMGSQVGLMPGLNNYNIGSNTTSNIGPLGFATGNNTTVNYSGILGGAALASNLAPGIGLTGGMGVMGSLNQARNVNMLRVLGIDVRSSGGSTMNDLPVIIKKLWSLLSRNDTRTVTPQDISQSMMSGNALDSLLDQYFGTDANLKNVVVSGLIQIANSKLSLYGKGTKVRNGDISVDPFAKNSLAATGAISQAGLSTGTAAAAESELIGRYSRTTNEAFVAANDVTQGLYQTLGMMSENTISKMLVDVNTMGTTLAGARGGAGGVLMKGVGESVSGLLGMITNLGGLKNAGSLAKGGIKGLVGLIAKNPEVAAITALTAALAGTGATGTISQMGEQANEAWDPTNGMWGLSRNTDTPTSMEAKTLGKSTVYTGDIYIDVTAPPGSDPNILKDALASVFTTNA